MSILIKALSSSEVNSLADLSVKTFVESHGHSAKPADIQKYTQTHFNTETLSEALLNPRIFFSKIYVDNQLAGYSKLILNESHPATELSPVAKFERLYLLKDFYGLGLGEELLRHNLDLAKSQDQKALWLFVWTENEKGLKFYQKNEFKVIGQHDFKISDKHSNPNYVMLKVI
ncbi:GNAT family N-acetyltransferase [Psychroflexus sediminis]|uniref:Acetyltransferase (GNAT) family protein n=1 Tax=Psychroflexus sediminis TaxID=470826 RepID=A0A1G7XIE9_9FLAO|nr:GNAT family N-acetyltransferase [Psychroflexus sediminis]SDG83914.1 Acetyltransferase (GNAT) family protein [Psychroflexus sediminis]